MTMRKENAPAQSRRAFSVVLSWLAVGIGIAFFAAPAQAQQFGDISGQVYDAVGAGLDGVSVEARGDVLPQARNTTTANGGKYRFRLLPPGNYELKFTFADGGQTTRSVAVLLQQTAEVSVTQSSGADMEEIVVFGSVLSADTGQGALKNSISAATIDALPVGQEYRDLQKLIPGVQYSEDSIRGPSAGGSGQDNAYQFDGVDVSMPLFGTLSAEPSSHDIAQVSVVRGGAKAIGFNRSGGFLMNTVSKSGTNEFKGEVSYQVQTASLTGDRETGDSPAEFDEDQSWTVLSLGGPIIRDRLNFYTSYYRPDSNRSNSANAYGSAPDFDETRDEFFGKLTLSLTDSILLDGSYRTSDRTVSNRGVGDFEAATTSSGDEATLDIAILEGSWIISDQSSFNFKITDFENNTASRPDTLFNFPIAEGDSLNIGALDQQGLFVVPETTGGVDPAFDAFIQPFIGQYGYLDNGVATGGGNVGGASTISDQDFSRMSYEVGFDQLIYAGNVTHDIHIGYQYQEIEEDLARFSNGWGVITMPSAEFTGAGDQVFFEARINQMSLVGPNGGVVIPTINSRSEMQSFEINDSIEVGDWTYNIGVLISNDILFGQGLAPEPNNPITGLTQSPGTRYKMYEVDWSDMIQPRLGANWDYTDTSSVYINYARYNPSASSLARAASWDRNLQRTIDVQFDANGDFLAIDPLRSSSGKVFQEGMTPRGIDEFLVGWTSEVSGELLVRAHVRYREGENFWEDTNNNARSRFLPPPGIPTEDYIPNLGSSSTPGTIRSEIGGSSYVIAELDGAYTKYWEASLEAEYNSDKLSITGSYVWSHYYGNFDQDNTTTSNDHQIFIGSSFIADGAGRQLWDFRDGNLRGDRRHMFKVYGSYQLDWDAHAGAFFVYQSGQPWEAWDVEVYRNLTGSSSDTSRYAEPAGSRTTPTHWQLDLNYTQNFQVFEDQNIQLRVDVYNVFDKQTGYNIQNKVNSAGFGIPRDFYNPRRIQLLVKYQF
jgi:carboxypeptidase family protein